MVAIPADILVQATKQALKTDSLGRITWYTYLTMPKICNSGCGTKITRAGSSRLPEPNKHYPHCGIKLR